MAVETKEVKAIAISKEVLELSEKLSKGLTVNEHGNLVITGDLYIDNAPKKVKDAVADVDQYDALFAASALHAFGPKAIAHLKEVPENKRVSGEINGGTAGRRFVMNYSASTGKKADNTPKDPSVTVVRRITEHADHLAVRQEIYALTVTELFS